MKRYSEVAVRWARRDAPTVPLPAARVTALEYYGAKVMPDYSGWWVYALASRLDMHVFYVGQSDNLISRLRDHSYNPQFRGLLDWRRIYLVPVPHQGRADVVELELIDAYQPEYNKIGRADELREKARDLNRPRIGGWNRGVPRGQASGLDRKQVK
jgi:hypothetical protein